MALPEYCAIGDVFQQLPELRTDNELGVIEPGIMDTYIQEASMTVRQCLQSVYDISVVEAALLLGTLQMVVYYAAIVTATNITERQQFGTFAETRIKYLYAQLAMYEDLCMNGSFLLDDGTALATVGSGISVSKMTTPSTLVGVLDEGNRIGFPTDDSAAN